MIVCVYCKSMIDRSEAERCPHERTIVCPSCGQCFCSLESDLYEVFLVEGREEGPKVNTEDEFRYQRFVLGASMPDMERIQTVIDENQFQEMLRHRIVPVDIAKIDEQVTLLCYVSDSEDRESLTERAIEISMIPVALKQVKESVLERIYDSLQSGYRDDRVIFAVYNRLNLVYMDGSLSWVSSDGRRTPGSVTRFKSGYKEYSYCNEFMELKKLERARVIESPLISVLAEVLAEMSRSYSYPILVISDEDLGEDVTNLFKSRGIDLLTKPGVIPYGSRVYRIEKDEWIKNRTFLVKSEFIDGPRARIWIEGIEQCPNEHEGACSGIRVIWKPHALS